jgi:hypothetical protein
MESFPRIQFTFAALVNLSPDSPTQMFKHNFRIFNCRMTLFDLSLAGAFSAADFD